MNKHWTHTDRTKPLYMYTWSETHTVSTIFTTSGMFIFVLCSLLVILKSKGADTLAALSIQMIVMMMITFMKCYSSLSSRLIAKWNTLAFNNMFWISTKVLYLQHCLVVTSWCHMKLHFMSLHVKPHTYGPCIFAVTCPLQFWQNGQNLLHAAVVMQGWNR